MAVGDLQRTLGRNVAEVRRHRGLSQERFADEIGFHRTYVGGLERGERNLSLQAIERLADTLGLDPLDLLAATDPTAH